MSADKEIVKGSTNVSRYIMLRDSADGTVETGYTITDLDLQYTRLGLVPAAKVDATALAATNSAHSDNKAIEIDATSSPGLYRVDWPDAAFASGVDGVVLVVSGPGLDPAIEVIFLVDYGPTETVDEITSAKDTILAALTSSEDAIRGTDGDDLAGVVSKTLQNILAHAKQRR